MDNYGLGMNRKYEQSPMRKPVPPVAPQLPSGASLAARGQQMNPYQPVNPQSRMNTYNNVQLPPTELGPNQSTAGVRDRIAGVYDPQSWNNATYSPGQIRTQVANRTEQTLDGIRNAPDRTGARSQYQYSPLAPASAFEGLNNASAANREQQMARIQTVRASQDQSLANDPQAARRMAAMTGQANATVDPNDYRGRMARATNQYNLYASSVRAGGKTPMSFDDFLSQLAPNAMTPEVQSAISAARFGKQMDRSMSGSRVASRGPNLQASQFLASRYGVPMQMPQDPERAAQWTQTLAMQGNPYAASLNQQAIQQGYATQQQAIDQAGQNYRAGLQYGPKPPQPATPPTIEQAIQFQGLLADLNQRPLKVKQDILSMGEKSPDWNDPAKRAAIVNRANQAEAEERARVQQQIDSMRGAGPLAGMFPGLSSPAAPAVMPSAPTGTNTTAPPQSATSQPVPVPAGSKDADAILTNLPSRQTGKPADASVIFTAWQDARAAIGDGREPTPEEVKKVLAERGYSIQSDEELLMNEGAATGAFFPGMNNPQTKRDYQDFSGYMNQNTEQFGLPLPEQLPETREQFEARRRRLERPSNALQGYPVVF